MSKKESELVYEYLYADDVYFEILERLKQSNIEKKDEDQRGSIIIDILGNE